MTNGRSVTRSWPVMAVAALVTTALTGPAVAGPPSEVDVRYRLRPLEPVAGTTASGATINDRGLVAGYTSVAGGAVHAAVWRRGEATDLGTLGGPGTNSAVLWPNKNNGGLVVGISQTDRVDPNREPWSCSAFLPARPGYACVGFVWRDGRMTALPTLGGTHGFAAAVNNRGQIVGWAENDVVDEECTEGQVLQFRAVRWDRAGRVTTELVPLPGDGVSAATAINDRGRVVGISGACDRAVGRLSARAAVVWDRGVPRQLPDLGGVAWNTPSAVNDRGDIAGFLNRSAADGPSLRPLPVWWTADGRLHRLDPPDGYTFGQALGINDRRQVVGVAYSEDFQRCTAVLWERGRTIVLQDEVRGTPLRLCSANDINARGQITGQADDPEGGTVGFVLTPSHG
jgi:probable HAF family extracellular repeat protein